MALADEVLSEVSTRMMSEPVNARNTSQKRMCCGINTGLLGLDSPECFPWCHVPLHDLTCYHGLSLLYLYVPETHGFFWQFFCEPLYLGSKNFQNVQMVKLWRDV